MLDIVGLYWHPPTTQSCCACTKKSQIRALGRTAPMLSMRIGSPEQRTQDYARHGTSTLGGYLAGRSRWGVAALDIATGRVTGLRKPRHRRQEFLLFLKHLARACPERELYRVRDNYATHKKAEIWCGWAKIFISGAFRAHLGIMNEPGGDVVGIIERQAIHLGPAAPSRS
ncbi:hypothetical protein [Rhodococcus koreensis]|uniref:hypothetical protein n=1 Tax=Rhodococcus koreensis TaxID=99653 RepID=UPI0036734BFA